jgi:3,4-dihydroxy 2-butanone 4-phosphate synthase/GTP cyclohydrolase II
MNDDKVGKIEDAIEDIHQGKMIILMDDEDRENEGDLVIAAEKVTAQTINFMATHGRGLICLALDHEIVRKLALPPMVRNNTARFGTNFTVSIDATNTKGPGISSANRARTVLTAIDKNAKASDLISPGHIFPLRAEPGGVLVRSGQTEGSVDLTRFAGLRPGAVICEVMNEDGTMARMPQLLEFSHKHGIRVYTIADLIRHRLNHEILVHPVTEAKLPTDYGMFKIIVYKNDLDDNNHVVLIYGDISGADSVLVRVHPACLPGDVFHANRCKSRGHLSYAMSKIAEAGKGVILYLQGPEDGRLFLEQIKALEEEDKTGAHRTLEDKGFAKMEFRDHGLGAQILSHLGLKRIKVITNNPLNCKGLSGFGLEITDWIPIPEQKSDGMCSHQ